MKRICLLADPSQAGERIDKYLALELDGYSRSFLQKQLKDGNVTVGDKPVKSSYQLAEDDEICVFIPDNREPDILPEDIPLSVLYEDEHLLVVDKPKGMVVHPSAGHYSGTLVNALLYHTAEVIYPVSTACSVPALYTALTRTLPAPFLCARQTWHTEIWHSS